MKNLHVFSVSLAAMVVFLSGCAHQGGPGGGPADTVPPVVRSAEPADLSTQVAAQTTIRLTFSEWISPLNIEKSVTLFPQPDGGVRINTNGKTVVIEPRKRWADSTTYHVVAKTTLKDLHGNNIGNPYSLIFATGSKLDSGTISGCVVLPQGLFVQPRIALFPYPRVGTGADTALFGMPDYLTQTDSSGAFTVRNVRRGFYTIVGFIDKNDNNRLDPASETIYLPSEPCYEARISGDTIRLFSAACDTVSARIASVRALSPLLIGGEWKQPERVDSAMVASLRLISLEKGARLPAIARYERLLNSNRFFISVTDSLGLKPYKLAYRIYPVVSRTDSALYDSVRFNGIGIVDTTRPRLFFSEPVAKCAPDVVVKMVWTKPVRYSGVKLVFADSLGDTVPVTGSSALSDTVTLKPLRRLIPGRRYTMDIPVDSVADPNGNHPVDSTGKITISLSTLTGDSLCLRLSGGIEDLPCDPFRKWIFTPFGLSGRPALSADSCGKFAFDSIPAGRGTLTYFTDRNGDNKPTEGLLIPWRAPEPVVALPDTVEARRNWEIEGIKIKDCEFCVKKSTPGFKKESP